MSLEIGQCNYIKEAYSQLLKTDKPQIKILLDLVLSVELFSMLPISILVSGVNFITRAAIIIIRATESNSKDKAPTGAGEVKPRAAKPIPIPNLGQESIIDLGTFLIESLRLEVKIRGRKKSATKNGKPEPIIPPIIKGDRLAI